MKKCLRNAAALSLLTLAIPLFAEQVIETGPGDVPIRLEDEAGNMLTAVRVYSDANLSLYIPDITTPSWIAWNGPTYRKGGKYLLSIFSFYKSDKACADELPPDRANEPALLAACQELKYMLRRYIVDTRKHEVTLVLTLLIGADGQYHPELAQQHHLTSSLAQLEKRKRQVINKVTAKIDAEIPADAQELPKFQGQSYP